MSFSGFAACKIYINTIKLNFFGKAWLNTQSCLINKSDLRHSLSLLKVISAVVGIVHNILKLTQTFENIS